MGILVFTSDEGGAPVLSGTVGALTDLLYACLVTGFNTKSLESLTRDGTTVTGTVAAGHGFQSGQTVRIAGANEPDYNGDFVITITSSTVFTYAITGTPTTPATGTITAKRAPLGWERAFSDTNKAVFRATAGTRLYLQVNDAAAGTAGAKEALCRGYETMSDVDTGTQAFPTTAQLSAGIIWRKSTGATSSAVTWQLIGDDRFFYLWIAPYSYAGPYENYGMFHFGDIVSFKEGDAYQCIIGGKIVQNNTQLSQAARLYGGVLTTITNPEEFLARNHTQVGGSTKAAPGVLYGNATYYSSGGQGFNTPNLADNGYHMHPVLVQETYTFRGKMPGLYGIPYIRPFSHWGILENVEGLPDRALRAMNSPTGGYDTNTSYTDGQFMLDVTGPWR